MYLKQLALVFEIFPYGSKIVMHVCAIVSVDCVPFLLTDEKL